MAIRRVVVAGNRTTFRNKEMCHEEIHRRSRVDLADRDPVAHGDCKRGPGVPVKLLVRQQRLLTISRASERFCSRPGIGEGGRLARASRPPPRYKINLADKAFLLAAVSLARMDVRMKRKSGQSNARQIKSRCLGMIT
jgi:hypothetical protein